MSPVPDELALHGFNVAILVTDGFEQAELTEPCEALETSGVMTRVVSDKHGKVQGFQRESRADSFDVDLSFDEADPDSFDAVLLPGGALNAQRIKNIPQAQAFVRSMQEEGKPIAVLGQGAGLLAAAGLLQGRRLAGRPAHETLHAGVDWIDQPVVEDGNWISCRDGADLPAFIPKMIELMARHVKMNVRGTADERPDVGAGS